MPEPLIVTFYAKLPQPSPTDDAELWLSGVQDNFREFRNSIRNNYNEGTLQRLTLARDPFVRQAAVLALGMIGTLSSNPTLATALQDDDWLVRRFAEDALWEVWFRGDDDRQTQSLQQAMQLNDYAQMLAALDDIIREAPQFAEAHNQRAILFYRRGEFARCVEDCKTTLQLNPFHYAAAAGMGHCYLKLNKPRKALRAFKQALEINPALNDLRDTVRSLRDALNEGE